jgi:predicted permease
MLREWLARLWATVGPGRREADMEAELRLHLELSNERQSGAGSGADDAKRRARMAGDLSQTLNALRDQRGLPWLDDFVHDVRFGLRNTRRNPLVTIVIVVSLALGVGANTALFSLIEATLLRDATVAAPEELVQFRWRSREWFPQERFAGSAAFNSLGRRSPTFSVSAFHVLRDQSQTLSDVFAFDETKSVSVTVDGLGGRATMQMVSAGYFQGLGVEAAIGRVLGPSDDAAAAPPVAVISHRFWERRFERDLSVVGTTVALDGATFTIVGVASEAFRESLIRRPVGGAWVGRGPAPDVWVAMAMEPLFGTSLMAQDFWWLSVMGRLKPGATADQVLANLAGPFRQVVADRESPPDGDVPDLRVTPARAGAFAEGPNDETEAAVLLGAIFGILLLVVCLNVANLLLSRSAARRAEIDIRLALGARRSRLIRQLLTENMALAVAGGGLGFALAWWGRGLFAASAVVSPDVELRLNAGVLGLTLALSALAGLIFGVVPAFRATRLRDGRATEQIRISRGSASRASRSLLVTQVAVSVVLLMGTGLFARTLGNWHRLDTGFDVTDLYVFQIDPASQGYDNARSAELRDRIVARIRAIPGVAGVTTSGPFWRDAWFGRLFVDGVRQQRVPRYLPVRHDYFALLGQPLLAGRGFTAGEDLEPPRVAVVDDRFTARYLGSASPIGRRVAFDEGGRDVEIVGVVGSTLLPGTPPDDAMPAIYLPERTHPADFDPDWETRTARYRTSYPRSIEVRLAGDPAVVLPAIRAAVAAIDPALPMLDPTTVTQAIRERLRPTRIVSYVWLSFAGVTLLLTALGLYGVLAFGVTQRTREIGIRTALGARRVEIVRQVTGGTSILVAIGIAIGLGVSAGVYQLVRSFVFGVTFYDPLTVIAVLATILGVATVAAFVPARRALGVDPTIALRAE